MWATRRERCTISLPPEEQRQLKRLKEGAQAEKKD